MWHRHPCDKGIGWKSMPRSINAHEYEDNHE